MSIRFLILILFLTKTFISIPNKYKPAKEQKKILRKTNDLSDDIAIIHLNDVHCGVNDKIGYDGFVLYRKELQQQYKNVIAVDVGDHVQGGTLGAISDGEAIIKIMNKVNFNVATLGNHEFDYGIEQLDKLGENITSKYICSNFCYNENKTTIYKPYKIIEAGDKKIGFVGVVTPLTFSKTYLVQLKDKNGEAIYDFLQGNNAQDLYDAVQKYINELRNDENVDFVILLAHLGMNLEQYTSDGLLSKLEGVDAIFDGHTHLVYNKTSKDKIGKDIPITQTGTKLESIGKLIIKSNGTLLTEIITEVPEPTNIEGAKNVTRSNVNRWVDGEIYDFINNVWSEYDEKLNYVVGHSDFDLIIIPEGSADSHSIYCRTQECTVGNLIADAVNDAAKGDFAIINGGGVRNNMYHGNITRGNIIEALPWFNNIIVKQLPGQIVLDALEFGVRNYPKASGGFPQVSSELSFDFDPQINSTVETDEKGIFVKVNGERRVSNVKVNGEKIDQQKLYNVSLLEFISSGGDGYSMIGEYEVYREALFTDTDAVADYILKDLQGTIPEKYKEFQGRINLVNGTDKSDSNNETDDSNNQTDKSDSTNDNYAYFNRKKSKKGLSAGSIVAIVLPLLAAAIIFTFILLMCKNGTPTPTPMEINSQNSMFVNSKK